MLFGPSYITVAVTTAGATAGAAHSGGAGPSNATRAIAPERTQAKLRVETRAKLARAATRNVAGAVPWRRGIDVDDGASKHALDGSFNHQDGMKCRARMHEKRTTQIQMTTSRS